MNTNQPSPFRAVRGAVYRQAVKAMFRIPPERIHGQMTVALEKVSNSPAALQALERAWVVNDSRLSQNIAGITFPRPLGLAAGFDKDAREVNVWGAIGFGAAEVGTVTHLAQPGNPVPRLFRLPEDRALLNRMGFNNESARAAAMRLQNHRSTVPVGVNLGKSKITEPEQADNDYRQSARVVDSVADYLVINVSSPNTPGLRDLQAVASLRPIIAAVQSESSRPLFVKIAPDLSDEDIDAVVDLAIESGLTGLIATNTTISREGLKTDSSYVRALGAGGISGAPVAVRSLEVLRRIHARAQGKLVLVSVGGIETAQQAWERIGAGAHLLQGYTALIYGGPDWIRDIHLGISQQLTRHGLSNLADAVGKGLPWVD
ncbi:quinone-dependent dihydroorotate dehydrogenase [Corynebacterium auriscanis]|uniref:quinone-dependent dihydroorotate dehydrogenase n=1 Tax=Corynebacterium auriscanis TaxID=99807 RepID=UPI0022485B8D|nr:quinone-dependent dihydroorotate dehydrogenase [Corynebacterium auriscanis]MCX2163751.1 quinone-dependent dihydroorotate dehydrogenase [Corynebacterium auriscanis]